MQSPLVELEHFRELLKYLGDMACLKSHFGSRYPCSSSFPGRFSACLPLPFCSRQAHSFLHLAMERDAAQSCSCPVFFPQ